MSKPVQLFTNILVARLLGPANFGVLGLASSLAVTLSLVAGLGLGDATYKYLGEYYHADQNKGARMASVILWTAILFSLALMSLLWFARTIWVPRVFPSTTSNKIVGLCLLLTLGNLLFALVVGILSGLQRFPDFTTVNVMQAASVAMFAVWLALYGAEGAIAAYVAGTFVAVLWGFWRVWRLEPRILRWPGSVGLRNLKSILNFSLPIWVGAFAFAPFVTFTLAFLARQPNGVYQLGVFNTANGLRMLVALVPGAITVAIAPTILREGGAHGERFAYERLMNKCFAALVFLTLTLLIPAMFLSDLIFTLYGRAYQGASLLFIPLTASAAIGAIGGPLAVVMLAKNRTWWAFAFGLIKSALMVVLAVLLTPAFLASGLTWAVVISEISLNVFVLEFCILTEALPRNVRLVFYSSTTIILTLMVSAILMPTLLRWALAVPLAAVVVVYYLRAHADTSTWLTSFVPAPLKPGAQRILGFITP